MNGLYREGLQQLWVTMDDDLNSILTSSLCVFVVLNQLLSNIKTFHCQCPYQCDYHMDFLSNFTVPGMCTWLRSLTSWCEQFPAFLCIAAAEPPRPHPDASPSAHMQGHTKHIQLHSIYTQLNIVTIISIIENLVQYIQHLWAGLQSVCQVFILLILYWF